jgi:uncharacterized protein (UPF0147 family)
MSERNFEESTPRKTFVGAIWAIKTMKREKSVVEVLRELAQDERVSATVRREAQEALRNWERLQGKEPSQ